MRKELNIFWSWGFISTLAILLLNDHVFKQSFDNWLTGKLSDLTGLFIFPIFFTAFFPKWKKHIYWITALSFIWWKSPFSNPVIELWNSLPIFPISRIIDYSDLFALIILPVSYWYHGKYRSKSIALSPVPLIIISSFAFIATSRAKYIPVYYEYSWSYSKNELIRRLNVIAKEDNQLPISDYIKNANYVENHNGDSMMFYVSKYTELKDTLFTKSGSIDTVYVYKIPQKDTAYISKDILYYDMDVKKYFSENNKDYCSWVTAKIKITGSGYRSKIVILGFDTRNCFGIFDNKNTSAEIMRMQKIIEKKLEEK